MGMLKWECHGYGYTVYIQYIYTRSYYILGLTFSVGPNQCQHHSLFLSALEAIHRLDL